jgi:uncharacterized iron-regulated membrane protein
MRKPALWPRNTHRWLSVVIVAPMLLVAATGILFEYVQPMGWRNQQVNAGWLPGYSARPSDPVKDIRGVIPDGAALWIAGRTGLYRVQGSMVKAVPALEQQELRNLYVTPQGLLATSPQGLWLVKNDDARLVLKGLVLQASGNEQQLFAVVRGRGPMVSTNGGADWAPLDPQQVSALASLPAVAATGRIAISQLIHDLHTGKALTGESGEAVWNHIVGLSLLFLCCTGFYMWWKHQKNGNGSRPKAVSRKAKAGKPAEEAAR